MKRSSAIVLIALCLFIITLAPGNASDPPSATSQLFPTAALYSTQPTRASAAQATPRYRTYPEFANVMTTSVTIPAQGAGDGYVFVAGMGLGATSDLALLIVDNEGEPVYIQPTPSDLLTGDFKRQVVNGVPFLTYHSGAATAGWSRGSSYVMDTGYTLVDTWTISNGFGADVHDMKLLDNGHALLLGYVPVPTDLTPYGGPADGTIMDIVIQEQDAAKNVVFEWRGLQHIPVSDSYMDPSESPLDLIHTNAIEVDTDGNLLVSNRNLSQIIKIDRQTGEVIWRLGGRRNEFTFVNDVGFTFQHDIRRLPNGHITLFDNGNRHNPPYSRALEYDIDETTKTITRTWQYTDTPVSFAPFMGNAQRLDNGNTLIGWGAIPKVTEVLPDGSKAFELALGGLTYRAFRYTWDALPVELPRLVIEYASDPSAATAYSGWNGATHISAYEIYGGVTADAMSLITTTARTGFETVTHLSGLNPALCVFKVRPVHAQGLAMPSSANVYRLNQAHCRALLNFRYFPFALR